MDEHFNLVDEPWIPIADHGRVSLMQIFSDASLSRLGGNPVQKIALLKLLLAIAQAAATPNDEAEWRALGVEGLATHCRSYLERWHERFWLYGDQPFLQMPAIAAARVQPLAALAPQVATGNTTVLNESQTAGLYSDADKALLLVCQMAFALGGKKTDNSITLTPGYIGKRNAKDRSSTGKPGPAVAYMGLLHSFALGRSVQETSWLNLLTREQVQASRRFPGGIGTPPWEQMPAGEDDVVARALCESLIGRLVPLCRFCLLTEDGIHYSEGIQHPDYKGGAADPSVTADLGAKKPKVLWTNPDKRPWRELTSLLSFLAAEQQAGLSCWQLRCTVGRASNVLDEFSIWSGGLRVSSNAGEQYASGSDDYVASEVTLPAQALGSLWFAGLAREMPALDRVGKRVYGATQQFFKQQKVDGAKLAAQVSSVFWQLCERDFSTLLLHCQGGAQHVEALHRLRQRLSQHALAAFDRHCPNDTARQLQAWAACRPNFRSYINEEV